MREEDSLRNASSGLIYVTRTDWAVTLGFNIGLVGPNKERRGREGESTRKIKFKGGG